MEPNNENIQKAKEELEAVCVKYDIALVPVVVHQGDRTFSSIEIIPRQQPQVQPADQASADQEAPKAE
jgi:hypothetical protein